VDNFSANFQSTSMADVPDDANYAKLATSQTTSNQIKGVLGNGAGTGVTATMAVTSQNLALNLFFNAQLGGSHARSLPAGPW
jgi:hypothetical protein